MLNLPPLFCGDPMEWAFFDVFCGRTAAFLWLRGELWGWFALENRKFFGQYGNYFYLCAEYAACYITMVGRH